MNKRKIITIIVVIIMAIIALIWITDSVCQLFDIYNMDIAVFVGLPIGGLVSIILMIVILAISKGNAKKIVVIPLMVLSVLATIVIFGTIFADYVVYNPRLTANCSASYCTEDAYYTSNLSTSCYCINHIDEIRFIDISLLDFLAPSPSRNYHDDEPGGYWGPDGYYHPSSKEKQDAWNDAYNWMDKNWD